MNSPTKQTARLAQWYRSVAHGLFYLLTFALPLLVFPWTLDSLEVNKQTLLVLTMALAMIVWLGAIVVERRVHLRINAWWWVVIAFFLGVFLSACFSLAPFTSWVGQSGQEYTSVLSLIAFCCLLFIGGHALSETMTQRRLWGALFLSSAIVTLLALAQLFSWSSIEVIGTPYALGVYLTIVTVLSASLWLVHNPSSSVPILPEGWIGALVRFAMLIIMVGSTIVLIAIDFWLFWVMLLVGTGLLFMFALVRANEFPRIGRFVVPMTLFVVAIVFLFLPGVIPNTFSSELTLSYEASWDITRQTLEEESLLFGSGPGTFVMDYTKYRSSEINQSSVWDERFDRTASHILTMLATYGLVPVLLYALLILWIGIACMHRLFQRSQPHDEWKMTFMTFGGWVLSVFAQVFYPSNMTLSFLFWLLTAVLVSQVFLKERTVTFVQSSRTALLSTFGFVVANVILLTMLFVSGARYGAEVAFAKAIGRSEQGATIDEVITELTHAAQFNRWSDVYQRNLAQAYLAKTAELVEDAEVHPDQIQITVEKSLQSAQSAVDLSPSNVLNWALLGDIYREVAPLATGADQLAIEAYTQSVSLAPQNPKYYVALARAYIIRADQLAILATSEDEAFAMQAQEERIVALQSAVENLEQALIVKNDYATAYYYLALAHERAGNISGAIERMVTLRDVNPYDVGISLQLGLLYLRQGKINEAKTELERTVLLSPSYANAHWYLAAVYAQLDDIEGALEQLYFILETNPDHEAVLSEIGRLQDELTAGEEVPEPLEGIEEVPVE